MRMRTSPRDGSRSSISPTIRTSRAAPCRSYHAASNGSKHNHSVFDLLVAVVAAIAGGIAAVAGFGIGSLLTPLLALRFGTKLAVAVVSVPHFVGTAVRFTTMWRHVDRRVLIRFGVLSAAGGLVGALLNARAGGPALTIVFGLLLLFAGASTLFGLTEKMRFGRKSAWLAGAVSGLFGGLVGNPPRHAVARDVGREDGDRRRDRRRRGRHVSRRA